MKIGFLLTSILLFAGTLHPCLAQFTLTGQSGNFLVPEARVIGDKKIAFGSSFNPQQEALILYPNRRGTHEIHNFVTLGFLPFMELTFNLTPIVDAPLDYGIGDRSGSLRFLLKKETDKFPALLFGMYIPLGTSNFVDSNFITGTKHFNLGGKELTLSAGVGIPWVVRTLIFTGFDSIDIVKKENNYQVGFFGSARWKAHKHLLVAAEYQAKDVNLGLIGRLPDEKCFVKLYTFSFKTVGFGVSYTGLVK
ncbi:YjbH domain-containing protein [Imperialibacter roseus]|uniref:YjbH domain-containing protein n=1 Tax=Imperialibacter roseus TaxID=1324217 RepID=A0ABZ0ILH4_9BACT|nr:YjbH domain-containing protein [Imperialibacter roseus]WOK05349.1 YjbH domain-containing protein [Imperialibacter roseus]